MAICMETIGTIAMVHLVFFVTLNMCTDWGSSFLTDVRLSMLLPDAEFEVLIEKVKALCSSY